MSDVMIVGASSGAGCVLASGTREMTTHVAKAINRVIEIDTGTPYELLEFWGELVDDGGEGELVGRGYDRQIALTMEAIEPIKFLCLKDNKKAWQDPYPGGRK